MILDVSQLNDNVFLGSCVMAKKPEVLKDLGIKHIVNLTPDKWNWEENGFSEYQIPINDGVSFDYPNILPPFFNRMGYWELRKEKVFIHCHMGVSRTASFAIAWLMHKREPMVDHRWHWSDCEDEVRKIRPVIDPAYTLKRCVLLYFGWDPYASVFSHSP